jgi:hypothetical protein
MGYAGHHQQRSKYEILPPLLLIASNLFLFTPFVLFQGSPQEFESGYLGILAVHAIALFAMVGIGIAVHSRLNKLAGITGDRIVALLFGVGILLWAQRSFLMWDYGDLDGRGIDWQSFSWQGYVDLSIWAVLLILCYLRPVIWVRACRIGCTLLILMQLSLLLVQGISLDKTFWLRPAAHQNQQPPPEHFRYSATQNVIHILLDSFQTDVFLELVRDEGFEDEFDGFTLLFENAAVSPFTSLSIPAIFSGDIFDGSMPFEQYYKQAIESGIPSYLFNTGYNVRLTPVISMRGSKSTSYFKTPNRYTASRGGVTFHEAILLIDVGLFRQSPHFVRRLIYNDNNWVLSHLISKSPNETSFQHKAFFRDYTAKLTVEDATPAYHFVHLQTLPDGSSAGKPLPPTRSNFKNEGKYILRLFVAFLQRLKDLDIYDASLIVLQGDHGSIFDPIVEGEAKPGLPIRMPALLTIKPPMARGALKISHAPTNVADVPATIQSILELTREFPGASVFDLEPNTDRTRDFVTYLGGEEDPLLRRQKLSGGSIYEASNWSIVDEITVADNEVQVYDWGDTIQFGVEGNASRYLGYGWTTSGSEHGWNNGTEASLNFVLEPTDANVELEILLRPFLAPGLVDQQRVKISVGNQSIGEWVLTKYKFQTVRMTIPNSALNDPNLKIVLSLPDAESPLKLGVGNDKRRLAIAVVRMKLNLQQP